MKHRFRKSRKSGGGYGAGPDFVNPGNQVFHQYTGVGKDCTGEFMRPGYISNYSSYGLPGFRGGTRRRKRGKRSKRSKRSKGGYVPLPAPFMNPLNNIDNFAQPTVSTEGSSHITGQPALPGQVPVAGPAQKGGRYGFFPEHLNLSNGVGIGRTDSIPCESSRANPLNMHGGRRSRRRSRRTRGGKYDLGYANFPTVQVGASDSMRYNAPNAGYTNDFMTFRAPSAVPGLTIQTPYAASSFNQACLKTGGGPVAYNAGEFSKVTMGELDNRSDFDGTTKGLPVKYGGRRKSRKYRKRF